MRNALRAINAGRHGLVAALLASVALCVSVADAAQAPKAPPERTKQIETWAHSLAVDAATYGFPVVAMYLLRESASFGARPKAAPGEIWRIKNIATPAIAAEAGYVTPNVNVVYGFGFMDLGREPVIVTAPDSMGRYYMIEVVDMWTNAFAYLAGVEAGYKGGIYALVGPGWKGELPPGVKRIDSPTRWVELQPRVHVKDQADLAAAETLLNAVTVKGLAEYTGRPAPAPATYNYPVPKINPKVASSMMQFDDPLQFWEIFSAAMNENPPPESEIKAVLPQFKYLGIELGKQWKRESVNPLILAQMKNVSRDIGAMMLGLLPVAGKLADGWIIAPPTIGMTGQDYMVRAVVAVIGLTSNTPVENAYYTAVLDGNRQPFSGAKRYTITFTQPMKYLEPVPPGFWSLTMYDEVSKLTVPNPINRYSLGSDNNLTKNADGSFTMYLQHDNPGPERESNWLPTPKGPFYMALRNYAPVPEVVRGLQDLATFVGPPPVVLVK